MNDEERNEKIAAARKLLLQRQRKKEATQNPKGVSPVVKESGAEGRDTAPSPSTFFDTLAPLEQTNVVNNELVKVGEDTPTERAEPVISDSAQPVTLATNPFAESNVADKLELEKLRENSEVQKHTIEILVSEKSELLVLVNKLQEELKNREGTCEELSGRLRVSRSEVGNLKSEVSHLREGHSEHNKILQRLERDLQTSTATSNGLRKQLEDSHDEIKDLKRRIEQEMQEKKAFSETIRTLESQLSMASVRLQQMSNESVSLELSTNSQWESEKEELVTKVNSLEKEKQQLAHQYEEYISSLNAQLKDLSSKYETALVDKDENAQRVNSLVAHIGELEKQIHSQNASISQHQSNLQSSMTANEDSKKKEEEIARLNMLICEKDKSLEQVLNECAAYRSRIEELENDFSRVADLPDAKLLQAAMESDRVAASRAIEQNKELKLQFQEMKDAYISASNKTLELSTQLEQMEKTCGSLKDEVSKYKEEEEKQRAAASNTNSPSETHGGASSEETPVSPEAMKLLEDKFKRKMNEFAELVEEKQRLEHLVIQLQSETETIGEYITLYQNQRILLQQRAVERDQQMSALAKEREELRSKLAQLNSLVPSLIQQNQGGGGPQSDQNLNVPQAEEKTSEKILQLLDEIGTSSLIQESANFHPCLYCSGKLITV